MVNRSDNDPWRRRCAGEVRAWLVTGAAGFIGSHLVEELLRLGQRVRGFDNLSTGSRANLRAVESAVGGAAWSRFEWIEGDVRDLGSCRRACAGGPLVLHQAALGSVPRSVADPQATFEVNVGGFVHIMEAARQARSPRVVYASSSSVYGDSTVLPKREALVGVPLSPYAASKTMGEAWARAAHVAHGQGAVGLRYFNVFGPRQSAAGAYAAVLPRWVEALCGGERPRIHGDGTTTRDFCPVANVVQANLRAALGGAAVEGGTYNIALGRQTSLLTLFATLRERLAARGVKCSAIQALHDAPRAGDVRHSWADITRARDELGYKPEVDFERGIECLLDACIHLSP